MGFLPLQYKKVSTKKQKIGARWICDRQGEKSREKMKGKQRDFVLEKAQPK